MANKIQLKIITPLRVLFEGEADSLVMRCREGDRGVLPGHAPLACMLGYGFLRVFEGNRCTDTFLVMGGVATIGDDRVTILSEVAERPEQIEKMQEELAQEKARDRMRQRMSDAEIKRAQAALQRALMRE